MFQSERITSGCSASTAASPSFPFPAWTIVCRRNRLVSEFERQSFALSCCHHRSKSSFSMFLSGRSDFDYGIGRADCLQCWTRRSQHRTISTHGHIMWRCLQNQHYVVASSVMPLFGPQIDKCGKPQSLLAAAIEACQRKTATRAFAATTLRTSPINATAQRRRKKE